MTAQRKPIIVLDAGHGGQDPGAIGNGLKEKEITLDLTLRVGKLLKARGATVLFTRGIDVFISLDDRAKMANQFKADFFCSLHVNAGGGAGGVESFVHSEVNGGATAAIQNVVHREISKVFSAEGCPDRGQKKANLAVLRETNMPAVLIEYGFIDVVKDACLLKNNTFLDRIAEVTADGIAEALGLPKPEVKECNKTLEAIEVLHKAGIIKSPQYWIENARPGSQANGEYVSFLIQGMADKLRRGG